MSQVSSTTDQASSSRIKVVQPPKHAKLAKNARSARVNTNISHLRRENELFRVLQNYGGIANVLTKDFFDAHGALVDEMAKETRVCSSNLEFLKSNASYIYIYANRFILTVIHRFSTVYIFSPLEVNKQG